MLRAFPNPEKQSRPELNLFLLSLKLFPRCPGKKLLCWVSLVEKSAVVAEFFEG